MLETDFCDPQSAEEKAENITQHNNCIGCTMCIKSNKKRTNYGCSMNYSVYFLCCVCVNFTHCNAERYFTNCMNSLTTSSCYHNHFVFFLVFCNFTLMKTIRQINILHMCVHQLTRNSLNIHWILQNGM